MPGTLLDAEDMVNKIEKALPLQSSQPCGGQRLNNTCIKLAYNYSLVSPTGRGQGVARNFQGELFGCGGQKEASLRKSS